MRAKAVSSWNFTLNLSAMAAFGFYKAPTVKFLMFTIAAASALAQGSKKADLFRLDVVKALGDGQLWRTLTGHFVARTPAELLLLLVILYQFRMFERQMGSSKFAAYCTLVMVLACTFQLGLALSFSDLQYLSSGPYALVFSLFVSFYAKVPKIRPNLLKLCGVSVSDKTLTYLVGLQLLFNDGWHSFMAGFTGIMCGVLYSSDIMGLSGLRYPSPVRTFFKDVLLPVFASEAPGAAIARRRAQEREAQRLQQQQQLQQLQQLRGMNPALLQALQLGGQQPPAATAAPILPPRVEADPAAVERLMNMGFSRENVERALGSANNNEAMAVNMLLGGQ